MPCLVGWLVLGTPPHFRSASIVVCSHLVAGLQYKEQVVVAILSCMPLAFVSAIAIVWAALGDETRLGRHSLYRLRQLT